VTSIRTCPYYNRIGFRLDFITMIDVYHHIHNVSCTHVIKISCRVLVIDLRVTIIYRQDTLEFNVGLNARLSFYAKIYLIWYKYKAIRKCYASFSHFTFKYAFYYIYIFFFYITLYMYTLNVHIRFASLYPRI
jgi:hypothetical protein